MKRHPVWPVAVEKTAPMRFWAGEQSTARPWDMRMGAATVVAAAIKSELPLFQSFLIPYPAPSPKIPS